MNNLLSFAKNNLMSNIFISFRKSTKHLSYPFLFSAVFLILGGIICSTPLVNTDGISMLWRDYSPLIINALIIGFIVHYTCKSSKFSIAAIISFLICDLAYFCFSGYHFGIIFTVIISCCAAKIISGLNLFYAYTLTLVAGLLFGILLGVSYPLIKELLMAVSVFFSGKGALFGALSNLYSITFGNDLTEIFYCNDYTGSAIINDEIITGVKDFVSAENGASALVSRYLSGKYLANIFIPAGAYICIYKKLEKNELNAVTLSLILSVLFGNNILFYAFLFFFNPIVYMGNLFAIFIGYLACELIDIRCGYLQDGSMIELIKYGDKWIYFILCGLILAILSYFVTRLLIAKFDIRGRRILPKSVKKIVAALGGEDNIERISNGKLYVKNPNLINILKIDCDIHENEVTMIYDEMNMLKDYF